jgi:hypothetical protein
LLRLNRAFRRLVTIRVDDFFGYYMIFGAFFAFTASFELLTSFIEVLTLVSILRNSYLLIMDYHVALPMTYLVSSLELVLRHSQNFLRTLFRGHRIGLIQNFHHV